MTITAVLPSQHQTNRKDVHDLLISMADAWITYCRANHVAEGAVRAAWHHLPEDLTGEGPFTYIGDISEAVSHDQGLRLTVFTGTVGYVDVLTDPMETDDRVNAFSDYMRDIFTANARTCEVGTGRSSMFQQIGARDASDLHEGPAPFAHFVVDWTFTVQEGRQ